MVSENFLSRVMNAFHIAVELVDNVSYKPLDFDYGFPKRRTYFLPSDKAHLSLQMLHYLDNKRNIVVAERITRNSKEGTIEHLQEFYQEQPPEDYNWKYFKQGRLAEAGNVRYDADRKIADGCYEFERWDGSFSEREYKSGMLDGKTTKRYPGGRVETVPYKNGVKHGDMEIVTNEKTTLIPYVKGVKHGQVHILYKDGLRQMYCYVDGTVQGEGRMIYPDGSVKTYAYKDGILTGPAKHCYANGDIEEYCYEGDKKEGPAKFKNADGLVREYEYKNGVLHGKAKVIFADGDIEMFSYKDGLAQGPATYLFDDGTVLSFSYKDSEYHGKRLRKTPKGAGYTGWHVDGKAEGLRCNFNSFGYIESYHVRMSGEKIFSFSPHKDVPSLDRVDENVDVPPRDIATLYKEALAEMVRHKVDDNEIIEIGLRMQQHLKQTG